MNKVPDREKRRREYLRKRAGLNLQQTIGFIMGIVCSLLVFPMLVGLSSPSQAVRTLATSGLLLCVTGAFLGLRLLQTAAEKEKSIAYVPPVEEQLTTAPAEEVLLRGSQALPAAPEELLRPAGSQETPTEELLRASLPE